MYLEATPLQMVMVIHIRIELRFTSHPMDVYHNKYDLKYIFNNYA
jgi:hypothetical protein